MRIDGLISTSQAPERGTRTGTAVTPYRDVQRDVEARREQPAPASATQGLESQPQARRVEASGASSYGVPANLRDASLEYQRPLSSRAAQALASYTSTAGMVGQYEGQEVLGLDLYA
ncbi:hypothetical protein NK553_05990 [Pseudomonas sp. ZM23]|uniref:Uncharacterized protein n=1 Tax=Pseudomonas triclosanedens TaxID=2961893 RepID=A0ABY6ZU29_9PSED|nr:hypothetical protein [Pseudomonas triclosanedens]MCP8463496.1 hypothetical protein [Pseudomonas triclosanedens]MCP8469445.1 hypothetical protein [Pseudomonas triclosanedens]MCP8474297.1 hypothetical protein [Pseudomonas triclosanedens]WAI48316.1 hypothetical protein OU419_21510 [Pseudomonas triclosanedens]